MKNKEYENQEEKRGKERVDQQSKTFWKKKKSNIKKIKGKCRNAKKKFSFAAPSYPNFQTRLK